MKEIQSKVTRLGYSFKEAAAATSLSRRTLEYMIAQGRLDAVKVGRRTVIKAKSLESLIGV
jgi:excisionase family DNA binding protein